VPLQPPTARRTAVQIRPGYQAPAARFNALSGPETVAGRLAFGALPGQNRLAHALAGTGRYLAARPVRTPGFSAAVEPVRHGVYLGVTRGVTQEQNCWPAFLAKLLILLAIPA
jgi:hypothetical protein